METKNALERSLDEFRKYLKGKEFKSIAYAAIKALQTCLQYSEQETASGLNKDLNELKKKMMEIAKSEELTDKSPLPLMAACNICEKMLYKDLSMYQTEKMATLKEKLFLLIYKFF